MPEKDIRHVVPASLIQEVDDGINFPFAVTQRILSGYDRSKTYFEPMAGRVGVVSSHAPAPDRIDQCPIREWKCAKKSF